MGITNPTDEPLKQRRNLKNYILDGLGSFLPYPGIFFHLSPVKDYIMLYTVILSNNSVEVIRASSIQELVAVIRENSDNELVLKTIVKVEEEKKEDASR